MPIRKKFEIYDGTPANVEKRLQGRERSRIASAFFYNDESFNPSVAVIAYEEATGQYPVPMHYEFKEWSLEEWDAEDGNYIYYGNTILQEGGPFYYLDSRDGVKVLTLDQHFDILDFSGWEIPTLTVTGNSNGGTAKFENLGGWPEDEIYVLVGNGDDANKVEFTGTKTQVLAQTFQLSNTTPFSNLIQGAVTSHGITTNLYSNGDDQYPVTVVADDLSIYIEYERPEEVEGS